MRVETTSSHLQLNSTQPMPLRRVGRRLSWCVFRQRRDHLKTERSANDSGQMKGCAKVNSVCYDLPNKSTPPSLEDVDGRGEGPVMGQRQVAREVLDSSCCCCCCYCCCTYTPAGEPIITSANSLPSIGESCLKAIQVPSDLIVSTEEAPKPSEYCERLHLTLASASLPASPVIPPIETHPFQVQPPPILARRVIELGQQRANLMESFCSAGDIQQANREKESSVAVCYNDEPPKAKNRSLLELRRGPRAALVLNLHNGASSNSSPLRKVLLGEMNAASEEDNRLLFAEHPPTSYSTFGHESSLCLASDETLTVQPPTALAVAATVAANLSPRPKTGEEPSRIADRVTLRTASLLLTPEALEAKLGQGGEDSLYKEFWDIPMNFANKADCPWVGVGQKNRYHEVLPHNNTRVVLPAINNDDMTSYINANYIHGYQGRPRAFIATQGPMSHTINDFWRMVWHTRAPAVVMLTKICEQDKRSKCELYLPTLKHESIDRAINTPVRADTVPAAVLATAGKSAEDDETAARTGCGLLQSAASLPTPTLACWGEEFSRTCSPVGAQRTFGNIHVRVIAVTQKESYTERKLILSLDGEERQVTHFWYIGWSDHSSPEATLESARSLLDLVHETEACRNHNGGSSLPSTPALTLVPNSTAVLPPASTRLLSRQAAEEWSDADFDLHFPADLSHEESSPVTALNFFFLSESEASAPNPLGPSSRACRASDPAPMAAIGTAAVGPVVVHCSAGVGRTGCFIALCIGCEQLRKEDKVDVLGIVSRLRLDRGGMVENSEQYTFLHAALCMYNAIRSGRELPILPAITNLRNQFTGPLR
ncbi:Receptor-type tyrosine-protein phosphatase R [Echinococcus granulosus]|uniref:protein-tyrosine-phosphatase n=1 Tax=Echinococcus granulosus TaxID=6210 RepID=W6USU4_ECHGR|nr:Receptor-type tyrosine-protein phosphatase R [Echinococcus granulosus]EUB63746.1 Receptor-type tyrosine-protein phosphatase R [Echinococcus granulosus]